MSDSISAASLLMAIVAVLYGAWYQEIINAARLTIPKHDKGPLLQTVNDTLLNRCLPLTIMTGVIFLVFLPDAIEIIRHSIATYAKHASIPYELYDSVRTAFCIIVLVSLAITAHLCRLTIRLINLHRKLK